MALIVAFVVAFVVAVACTPVMARIALRLGVVDQPGPLKVHERPVPYLGGVAVFLAVAVVLAVERPSTLVPLAFALVLGVIDDVADIAARVRLGGEVAVGVVAAVVVPTRGIAGAVVTVGLVVLLCNAVNLLDGLDGLASAVCAAGAAGFAIVLGGSWSVVALALAGALVGFLVWNRPPARIYLGDAGSYMVGTTLALLLATTWGRGEDVATGVASVLFVAVPIADMTVAIVRRARARRPLFVGDRGHVYDQLVDRGWPAGRVTVLCVAAQVVLVAIGIAIAALPAAPAVVATAVVVLAVGLPTLRTFSAPGSWST